MFTGISFLGEEDRLEFPTLVSSLRLNKRTVGQVIYFYNQDAETLNREQRDFAQVYSDEASTEIQSLKGVSSLEFRYYFYDEQKKEYLWQEEWSEEEVPLAVRMVLEFNNGVKIIKFTKTVSIGVSG